MIILAPAMGAIGLLIRADSPGPVVYTQLRSGLSRKPFRIYKFRTMVIDAEARLPEVLHLNLYSSAFGESPVYKIQGDPRVTRVGRFLRPYALDEIPQLLNVIKGDMSLVGPRPLTLPEDAHVSGSDSVRSTVKPGISGLWQVTSRDAGSFEDMMRLDREYVTNWSFRRDVLLLVRTLPAVLRQSEPC
jgi:lipopolysaccharide/colanic/teichoic acid biosynthesis glycosyltransferase